MTKYVARFTLLCIAVLALAQGCKDLGTAPSQPSGPPTISAVNPDSAAVGDTVQIVGTNFGDTQGLNIVLIGGRTVTTVTNWAATEIRAEVPLLADTGSVKVTVNNQTSNGVAFRPRLVLYSQSVNPIFQSTCIGCHGGQNNLFLDSRATLLQGNSTNGPVVFAGNGEGSYIVRMLRGTVTGKPRMPYLGPYLPDAKINKISTWIQQGAKNN